MARKKPQPVNIPGITPEHRDYLLQAVQGCRETLGICQQIQQCKMPGGECTVDLTPEIARTQEQLAAAQSLLDGLFPGQQ